ncbi:hypothetical protein GQ53DRAFT_835139 [Thozetella sp. PMI_491]|nr:hypothetical protein GQ53DRAFT_835139 [Thozetella sp. PMI_491]
MGPSMETTSQWPPHYSLVPLDRSKREIRLLTFEKLESPRDPEAPPDHNLPITCRFMKASLDNHPQLRAMSYTWGEPNFCRRVRLRIRRDGNVKDDQHTGEDAGGEDVQNNAKVSAGDGVSCSALNQEDEGCASKSNIGQADPHTGGNEEQKPLEFVESEIAITHNLYLSLLDMQHLSQMGSTPMYVWVDAICINQQDYDEKAWQVPLMSDIYTSATVIHGWLGPIPEDVGYLPVASFIGSLERLASTGLRDFSWMECVFPLDYVISPDGESSYTNDTLVQWLRDSIHFVEDKLSFEIVEDKEFVISLSTLRFFLSRPFWKRVWILQEMALGTRVLLHFSGEKNRIAISSRNLYVALTLCAKAAQLSDDRFPQADSIIREDQLLIFSVDRNVKPAQWISPHRYGVGSSYLGMLNWRYRQDSPWEPGFRGNFRPVKKEETQVPFCEILDWNLTNGGLQATEPADYIYGFTSMASDWETLGLEIDYKKPAHELYTEFAVIWIRQMGLEVLKYCPWPRSLAHLPSWVPDLSKLSQELPASIWNLYHQDYGVCFGPRSGTPVSFLLDRGSPTLVLTGAQIDSITKPLIAIPASAWDRKQSLTFATLRLRLKWAELKTLWYSTAYQTFRARRLAFAATLTAGGLESGLVSQEASWSLNSFVAGYQRFMSITSIPRLLFSFLSRAPIDIVKYLASRVRLGAQHPDTHFASITAFKAITRSIADLSSPPRDVSLFLQRLQEIQVNRKIFFTKGGYLCLAPLDTRPGDIAVYFEGAKVPFILRRQSNSSERFTLVGEAFIFGAMYHNVYEERVKASQANWPARCKPPDTQSFVKRSRLGERRIFEIE